VVKAKKSINTIMKPVDHKDIKTTFNIYKHVTEMKEDASQKVQQTFGNILYF